MSTIQLDFNLPERFDLEYVGSDGERHRPIMIHRALFGSIERFFGVLTEHYAGAFPPWLAPVQTVAIPISSEQNAYLDEFVKNLRQSGVRAELDAGDERMQKKIREHTLQKVPVLVLAGGRDQARRLRRGGAPASGLAVHGKDPPRGDLTVHVSANNRPAPGSAPRPQTPRG
jgi:threonyl-tRNA synthetase